MPGSRWALSKGTTRSCPTQGASSSSSRRIDGAGLPSTASPSSASASSADRSRWPRAPPGRRRSSSASIATPVLEQAMVRHAIDVASDDLMIISEADLVSARAPVGEIIRLLPRLSENVVASARRHRRRQHQARHHRRRARTPGAPALRRRPPAGGRGAGRLRGRATGPVRRPPVAARCRRWRRARDDGSADRVCRGTGRETDHPRVGGRARPAARLPQPPAAAGRIGVDGGGRRGRR